MMDKNSSGLKIAAGQFVREREYWSAELAEEPRKSYFLYDYPGGSTERPLEHIEFSLEEQFSKRLTIMSQASPPMMHVILATLVIILLNKYSGNEDIIVGTSIDKQEEEVEKNPVNTILPVRIGVKPNATFKELLLKVREKITRAFENQNFPIESFFHQSRKTSADDHFSLFDVSVILENIQDKKYLRHMGNSIIFSFVMKNDSITGEVEYRADRYRPQSIRKLIDSFSLLLNQVLFAVDLPLDQVDLLSNSDWERIEEFNRTQTEFPAGVTLFDLFEQQVKQTPGRIAMEENEPGPEPGTGDAPNRSISYRQLMDFSAGLAQQLQIEGVKNGVVVGLLLDRSIECVAVILAILKAGGAYLPMDPSYPTERIRYMLADSGAPLLITRGDEEMGNGRSTGAAKQWPCKVLHIEKLTASLEQLSNGNRTQSTPAQPGDIAYVIYTSGSSGSPKGVMVQQHSVVNYILWAARTYVKEEVVNFPLFTSLAFDLTVTSIFTPLLTGSKIVIYGDVAIDRLIEDNTVDVVKLTPAHLNLVRGMPAGAKKSRIRRFIVGGEQLHTSLAHDIYRMFEGRVEIFNEYGPTEATVGCMIYRYQTEKQAYPGQPVPIGVPSANNRVYLVDKALHPVPVGAAGEMLIAGNGLARGYLNHPELTANKFIASKSYRSHGPYTSYAAEPLRGWPSMGLRGCTRRVLYRTGDLARFLHNGEMEFIGRIDEQVKIRGFRIELVEIENRLLSHNQVKEALVIDRENEAGDKYLCAYVVTQVVKSGGTDPNPDPMSARNNEEDISVGLRQYLSNSLPAYMVPSFFVELETLPLTANGKIDRKALPEPQVLQKEKYRPPRNEIEKRLVDTWQSVLGIERLGIDDNFFYVGGDSIKSIQIISRLSSSGYKLEMTDLFQYPVIEDLAHHIKKTERIPDQGPVLGTIPLTPIQHSFFEAAHAKLHHFNQAILFYPGTGTSFDKEIINKVFTRLQEHHDALRMTYHRDPQSGLIVQTCRELDHPLSLQEYDLRDSDDALEKMQNEINRIQAGIDLEKGPLMKLGLFHLEEGDRLLVLVHHLVIDGISWRILLEDIETLYADYSSDKKTALPKKTDSFKVWAEKLNAYASSEFFLKEKDFWISMSAAVSDKDLTPIPPDFPVQKNMVGDAKQISFSFEEDVTERLLKGVNHAYNTEINDIMMTALVLSLQKSSGLDKVLVSLEGHGRENIIDGIDISRTMGWFTSEYPVLFDVSYAGDIRRSIKEVKETLRKIPNKGIGYGILKYLSPSAERKDLAESLKPQIKFNYLGEFDNQVEQASFFKVAAESSGISSSPHNKRQYELEINGMVAGRRLSMTLTYNSGQFKEETVSDMSRFFKSKLEHLISHCSSMQEAQPTPSDFTYKGLSIEKIDLLQHDYRGIEDIYTLTPMQEGMLFHALVDESSKSYFEQTSYRLQGKLDVDRVEKSLNELVQRHDILRTAFVHRDVEKPVQLVLKNRKARFYYEDISKLSSWEAKETFVKQFKAEDKDLPFNLTNDKLFRVSVLRLNQDEYEFIWSFHHILMDGWCVGILISEFFEIYSSALENRAYQLPDPKPFRHYIRWLEQRDKEAAAIFWQQYLDAFEEPASIPNCKIKNKREAALPYKNRQVSFTLDLEQSARLNRLAARFHVTANTLNQVLWGILLGKYNGKEDVVFGAVVSGRPSGLDGVESMIGLFINTIPVRIAYAGDMPFSFLLKEVQAQALAAESHHYYPLALIQAVNPLKQELIDHIFIFENYPIAQQIEGYGRGEGKDEKFATRFDFSVTQVEVFEQTNYDFNVIISGSKTLSISFQYNENAYDKEFIEQIARSYRNLFEQVIEEENADFMVKDLALLTREEKKKIVYDYNDTGMSYPHAKTIHHLFEEQVEKTPGHIAVVFEDQKITYRELNERADFNAGLLNEEGCRPGDIVGIMMERSVDMVAGVLAILKTGAAYLPIDPVYPQERIEYMLQDSGAHLLITGTAEQKNNQKAFSLSCRGEPCVRLVDTGDLLDDEPGATSHSPKHNLPRHNPEFLIHNCRTPLAYVIYTSGSTGRPKGVMITHRSAVNYIHWAIGQYVNGENLNFPLFTSLCFDLTVTSVFTPLLSGNSVVIYPGSNIETTIAKILFDNQVGVIKLTPTHFKLILELPLEQYREQAGNRPSRAKRFILGGESLSTKLASDILKRFDNTVEIYNEYGPTEATVGCMIYRYNPGKDERPTVPVGVPAANVQVYILDKNMEPVPVGASGEMFIGGDGLARGYLNNPELTAEKFARCSGTLYAASRQDSSYRSYKSYTSYSFSTRSSLITHHSSLLYRSGDLARFLDDGNIEFIGRIDHQVKIRGFRIECGEIENCLKAHEDIKDVVVLARDNVDKEAVLCAYVVTGKELDIPGLKTYLSRSLPTYMIPSLFVRLDSIPLTSNGKIDRKTLDSIGMNISTGIAFEPPGTELEEKIAEAWKEVLNLEKVSIHDNFFDIGGHSINLIKLHNQLSKSLTKEILLVDLFHYSTIHKQAEYIAGADEKEKGVSENIRRNINKSIDIMDEAVGDLFADELD